MLFSYSGLFAQELPEADNETNDKNTERETPDTTKLRISVRSLRGDFMSFDTIPFDTLIQNIHLQHQAEKKYMASSFLGNIGLALKPGNYFEQKNSNDFFFTDAVEYNFIHKNDILYFKTNRPYSNISYNASAAKNMDLQSIKFLHSQNVNKKLNVGTLLNLHSSNGMYQSQKSSANGLSLFSGYNGDYYSFNAVLSYNTLKNNENGGIANDTLFENDKDKGSVYPTAFSDANTNIRNTYFFISQRFNLAGVRDILDKENKDSVRRFSGIGLLHTFEYSRNKRSYTNETGISDVVPYQYYTQYNNDSISTNDSLYFLRLDNRVELLLGKQNPNEPPILIRAGLKSLYDKFKYSDYRDTVFFVNPEGKNDTTFNLYENHYNNVAFTGGISLGIKSFFLLDANAEYYFGGYKSGDLYLNGKLTNRFSKKPGSPSFIISMDISRYKPGYFYDRYISNHFAWENNGFIPVKEVRTGLEFTWAAIELKADFNYALLSSPVYFDSISFPRQSNSEISVLETSIFKGFKAGVFHTSVRAMLQVTSDDRVVPLPLFSAYNSSYIELKLFKKIMTTQFGYDLRYNTEYYAPGYKPDLGVFHNQRLKKLGNYPYVDVFLNVKLKRMRFFLKLEHVNSNLLSRTYYTTLHYPMNSRMLMYGLSWNFYD